jgi:ankyrin repeat protein
MSKKLPLLALLTLAVSRPSHAAPDDSPIFKAMHHIENDAFTPPAENAALQALLAQHPKLTFLEACGVGDTAEMTRQLKRDPKLATTWTKFGWSALHLAAFSGVPGAVQMLIDRGADVQARARNKFKNTPLQVALLDGQLATAKLLIERGADPMVRQAGGFAPLHEAALLGRRDLVDLLLDAGAEINARSDDGRTPLSEAQRSKHAELADYLRSKGGHGVEITADTTKSPD